MSCYSHIWVVTAGRGLRPVSSFHTLTGQSDQRPLRSLEGRESVRNADCGPTYLLHAMFCAGLEYRGNDIFDQGHPMHISERDVIKVFVNEVPIKRFRISSFEVNVIETPPDQSLSSYTGSLKRLSVGWVKDRGVFLFRKCSGSKSLWARMVGVAKIDEHPIFRQALLRGSSLKSVYLHLGHLDDKILSFSVYLPQRLIVPDLDCVLRSAPSRIIDPHDLTSLLRMFNLIDSRNYYCKTHRHDAKIGSCCLVVREYSLSQSSQIIQDFFDEVHSELPHSKKYSLRTEKLTARLRPYQRDAVRFMIDRELRPNLRLHHSWFYYHIKMETDGNTLYYLPNLATFVSTPPVLPRLSTCGGILADEMGLGKTVELLALITSFTPDHTPDILERAGGDCSKMDEVDEVMDDLISNVVAAVEGEKAVQHFKNKKREIGVMYYSKCSLMPVSPTKKMIVCEECGTSCIEQRVHWSPGLSLQTRFICPECIMATKELIPIKTTLIVVPNAIAHQWYEEIRKHVKDEVKIDVYKGVAVDGYKHPHYLNQFDIVITTYDVITREKSFLEFHNPHERLRKRSYEMAKSSCTPLFSVLWWRVCLDESQMVDRGSSIISSLCKALESRARWSITGTPISSSIKDVYGLINFIGLRGLDQEWIFDQCLLIPYLTNANKRPLISLMAKIMWRTEKKHLEESGIRVISHVEMVTLSPMEERMYSDLLIRSKGQVLQVVNNICLDRKLVEISREVHCKLLTALAKVQLFLLTSLTGSQRMKMRKENGNDDEDDHSTHFSRMFTPASLFRRLLREKKIGVSRAQREVLMHYNGMAAILWQNMHYREALQCYTKAITLMLTTGPLNENIGQPNAVVFTTKDAVDEKFDDDERGEREGRVGNPIACDSFQFVHIYRNVQWLLIACPELVEESTIDMGVITPFFHQAWRTYSRIEESMFKEKEIEWGKMKKKVEDCNGNMTALLKWIETLDDSVCGLMNDGGKQWGDIGLKAERRVGIRFSNFGVMIGWMKKQLDVISNLSHDMIQLIDRCIEVCNQDDLEDIVSEGRYRLCDLPEVVKSPKKNRKESEDENIEKVIGPRKRGLKKKIIEMTNMHDREQDEMDSMEMLKRNVKDQYDECVLCMRDGEFDESSQQSCMFCATQAMHQRMQLKDESGQPSRSRLAAIELLEKELSSLVLRDTSLKEKDEGEWKALHENWQEACIVFNSFDFYWRSLLIVMLEKINRIRELRQCTLRSERDKGFEDEEKKMNRANTVMEKGIHNVRYVYSLRDESGLPSSSSLSTSPSDPSSRECPICFDRIGEAWFVFPCAHLNCGKCFNQLVKLQGTSRISCSVCRSVYPQASILYVSNVKNGNGCLVDSLNLNVKLDKIVRLAISIMNNGHLDKIVVFTSLTLGSSSLKSVFTRANLPFVYLDSDPHHNAVALSKFRNDPHTKIMLIRYEFGGRGLNLTVANHIIFADTVDDVSLEKQAIGRCDRIGQKKDVHLYYILARDTVDERMYNLTREVTSTNYIQDDNRTVGTFIDLFTDL